MDNGTQKEEATTLHHFLIKQLENHGDKIAQVDAASGEHLTFADVLRGSADLAEELRAHRGLRPGLVVLVIAENNAHFPWVLLGILRAGASAHPISPSSTKREVQHVASVSRPHIALLSPAVSSVEDVIAGLREVKSLRHILVFGSAQLGDRLSLAQGLGRVFQLDTGAHAANGSPQSAADIFDVQEELLESSGDKRGGSDAVALILSSSGTTGIPKGVMLTHANLLRAMQIGSVTKRQRLL